MRGVATSLTFVAVAAIFLVSSDVLTRWGFNYNTPGGSPLSKVHPATWLALAALAMRAAASGNVILYFDSVLARFGGVTVFAVTVMIVLVSAIAFRPVPFTALIDTFVMPIALFFLIVDLPPVTKGRFALLMHVVLFANACLAIYEFRTGWRLTPVFNGGFDLSRDWRSSALLGHPLANAAIAGVYVVTLAAGGGRDLPYFLRPLLLLVQLIAMAAFGGRTAIALMAAMLAVIATVAAWRILRGRTIPLLHFAMVALAIPILAVGVAYMADSGFFDQLLGRFVNDNGSAKARLEILPLLRGLSWHDVIFGPDLQRLSTLQYLEGVEYGIESFWINFALLYGLGVSIFFFFGLICFLYELVRATGGRALLLVLFVLGVATTGVSISAKSTELGMVVALALATLRPDSQPIRRLR